MATEDIDYGEVIHKFYAGRQYGVTGPRYEDINWFDEELDKPTVEELEAKWEEIKDEVALNRIYEQRTTPGQYPAKEDLIIALWKKVMEGNDAPADELQALREEIKAKYPKP